ncbi:MAG: DNA mismatch repair protein MutS [bacterium]
MNVTPLFKQYLQLKEKAKDAILLFRVGDFYETYFEDAHIFSQINSVVLTKRTLPDGKTVPMAGVPFHSVDNYIKNLLNAGYKVAIAEQLEDAQISKGNLVKRDIVEIITPGTITSYNYLNEKDFNFLMVVDYKNSSFYIIAVDISVLEGYAIVTKNLSNMISYFNPSEIVFSKNVEKNYVSKYSNSIVLDSKKYDYEQMKNYVADESTLFLLENGDFVNTFELFINYLEKNMIITNSSSVKFRLKSFSDDILWLDASTLKNLEIVGNKYSLSEVLDHTSTSFGARRFKIFITQPLKNIEKINQRLECVKFFVNNPELIIELREKLKKIPDIERLLSRFSLFKYNFKDLVMLKNFFISMDYFANTSIDFSPYLLKEVFEKVNKNLEKINELKNIVLLAIEDEIKSFQHVDLILKEGFNDKLDEYIYLLKNNEEWLKRYENELRLSTGIRSLKISYNQVFGYYIEVSKANLNLVPSYFERKQTLVNAERYSTKELKEFEAKLENAVNSINSIQQEIIKNIISLANENRIYLMELIENISFLDIIISLAYAAVVNNYTEPILVDRKILDVKDLRHPIYEKYFEKFVPNDVYMDEEKFFIILTGPNMGGKSTFLKSVALNVLLAQFGSFVPASKAIIGIADGIFTRIGASDDIIKNRSTFMVEMLETAYILDNCTERSLVIMDELGRGTSTYDGMAIAWAVCQYLASKVKCRSILATHFHQLSNLEKFIHSVSNYNVQVLEKGEEIVFTYKVLKGAAQKSYGIFVAKLAGVKPEVIDIANQILENFEKITGIRKVQEKLIK